MPAERAGSTRRRGQPRAVKLPEHINEVSMRIGCSPAAKRASAFSMTSAVLQPSAGLGSRSANADFSDFDALRLSVGPGRGVSQCTFV